MRMIRWMLGVWSIHQRNTGQRRTVNKNKCGGKHGRDEKVHTDGAWTCETKGRRRLRKYCTKLVEDGTATIDKT